MQKKNCDATRRMWNLLRIALLWGRKGGVCKRRVMMELRLVPKFIKSLGQASSAARRRRQDQIHYGERELSFDKTPIFHVKMHRPASMRFLIPCITPPVDFDYDFDDAGYGYGCDYDCGRKSFLKDDDEEEEEKEERNEDETVLPEEEGIDLRAEEFIANFYQQIKMQRQISYLEYHK